MTVALLALCLLALCLLAIGCSHDVLPAPQSQHDDETVAPPPVVAADPQPTLQADEKPGQRRLVLEPAAEPVPVAPPPEPITAEDAGGFVVSLCTDHAGRIWLGTEDEGVLRFDPAPSPPDAQPAAVVAASWRKFTQPDGLGDPNAYALACDGQGRIWAGLQQGGVAVYNGDAWRTYGVVDGPLGERVFDIAIEPTTGDVWLATCLGLTRYQVAEDRWSYITRADGLPEDQVQAVAFAADGTLYAGLQTQGVAIASPADNYQSWRPIKPPSGDAAELNPTGKGLPTGLVNDLLVTSTGSVYVATTRGLAVSKDAGKSFTYLRGREYAARVKGRWGGAPKNWKEIPKEQKSVLLPEDYVTCLAEDAAGRIWLGFRQQGVAAFDPTTGWTTEIKDGAAGLPDNYVTAILPTADGPPYVGTYGQGFARLNVSLLPTPAAAPPVQALAASAVPPPLPSPAAPPTVEELTALTAEVTSLTAALPPVWGTFLHDDWQTKGDWVGRLGRQYAVLCAMDAPLDHTVSYGTHYQIFGNIGPNGRTGERLRRWCHRVRWDDPRVLYNPHVGYRRQADWDDHAEAYPMTHEGPDVWVGVEVPEGIHRVTLYFFNKDGHSGHNRYRDYLLELKGYAPTPAAAEKKPTLAAARVKNFWGGVHKSFAVQGPGKYLVKVGCNDSFNTITQAVFCDQLTGPAWPHEQAGLPWMGGVPYAPPAEPALPINAADVLTAAVALEQGLVNRGDRMDLQRQRHLLAYRAAQRPAGPPDLLANWAWRLRLWDQPARQEFQEKMASGYAAVQENTAELKSRTIASLKEKYQKEKSETP